MNDILEMKKLRDGCPVMVIRIPKPIMKEIDIWVKESKRIKSHPLAELKAHQNVGYLSEVSGTGKKHNSYQCSISPHLIDQSFWLAWVLRLTAKYWGIGASNRDFNLRKWEGHFDGYDIWTNFACKGDDNPSHNHAGFLSGVIYYQNHNHPTYFNDYNCAYEGKNGTMIMFPSHVYHHVKEQTSSKERITLAFNINKRDAL